MSEISPTLKAKVDSAPDAPGCYLFYDRMGNIIYVGKSKRLHSRVRSYFTPSAREDERIEDLLREIRDVSYVQAETELDALIMEYRLIKKHKPWFNAQHIRSLRPHFLRIQTDTPFPTVVIVGDGEDLGELYLGPFKDAFKADEALAWLNRIWHTPMCGKSFWPDAARPCLYYEMGKCFAPCCSKQEIIEYPHRQELLSFLSGDSKAARNRLKAEMSAAASEYRFEDAGETKEAIDHLTSLARKIEYGFHITPKTHAILLIRGFGERDFSAFYILQGKVHGRVNIHAKTPPDAAADGFIKAIQANNPGESAFSATEACLAEISAHRRFALLPPDAGISTLHSAYSALHLAFIL